MREGAHCVSSAMSERACSFITIDIGDGQHRRWEKRDNNMPTNLVIGSIVSEQRINHCYIGSLLDPSGRVKSQHICCLNSADAVGRKNRDSKIQSSVAPITVLLQMMFVAREHAKVDR